MKKKTPRAICLDLLSRAKQTGLPLDRLLTESFKRYRHLTPLDRSFLTELTYGVFRWERKLDWVIHQFSKIPFEKIEFKTLHILRLGLYQILFLSRTPASAAVNESVELAKQIRGRGGAGFVNAVLRSAIRKKGEIRYPDFSKDPSLYISVVQSHPLWLVQRWVREMGIEETIRVCTFNNQISSLTLRANTLRIHPENLMVQLKERGLNPFPTPYSKEGMIIKNAPPTTELPLINEGLYMIQNEASQLVTALLDPKPGEQILDACAAPGGKTTHMAQRMKNQGEIYALDISKGRLDLLEEICQRLGIRMVKTIRGDATKPLPFFLGMKFDRILVDAPCSGFGTLRKNPDLKWKKKEQEINRLGELQLSILRNLAAHVKEGGVLLYSTCTVFREENEDVVERFLEKNSEFRLDQMEKNLPDKFRLFIQGRYFKTFPPRDEMDGFFVARMIKGHLPSADS